MIDVLRWWAGIEVIGAVAFPLTFVSLRFLPDRGYGAGKALGLLLVAYLFWLLVSVGLLPNAGWSVVAVIAGVGAASGWVARREWRALRVFIRRRWVLLLAIELLFVLVLVVAAWLKSFQAEINLTERPFEFALLNAVLRSDGFPPDDPWFAGHAVNYYYFGYVLLSALTRLTGVAPSTAFSLALPLVTALAAVAVFSLSYDLVAPRARGVAAAAVGLLGIVLLLLAGSLEGVIELLAIHGVDSAAFYDRAAVFGLDGPRESNAWYPTEWWFFWRATRMPSPWDIQEFPFFSMQLGDVHPHVLALPFMLVVATIALNIVRSSGAGRWWPARPLPLVLAAGAVAATGLIDPWCLPLALTLVVLAAFTSRQLGRRRPARAPWAGIAGYSVVMVGVVGVLLLPFLVSYSTPVSGIAPVLVAPVGAWPPLDASRTTLQHLATFWGPLLWLGGSLIVVAALRGVRARLDVGPTTLGVAIGLAPLLVWGALALADGGRAGLLDQFYIRGWTLLTPALLTLIFGLAAVTYAHRLVARETNDAGSTFAIGLAGLAVLMLLGAELFQVTDYLNTRANTVFRLYYQAWMLLSIAGAYATYRVLRSVNVRRLLTLPGAGALAWSGVTVALVVASLVYGVIVTFHRTESFARPQTLDGLQFVARWQPDEFEALEWLRANAPPDAVLIESIEQGSYSGSGRISGRTGIPAVMGWPGHESAWRGEDEVLPRVADIEAFFSTSDAAEARRILQRYDVTYVFVGQLERILYGEHVREWFATFLPVAFENGDVTIFAASGAATAWR
jgi:YYY domain-containing protein